MFYKYINTDEIKQSGKSAGEYAQRMHVLGKYHGCNIHQWGNKDGEKEERWFHPLQQCSCSKCGKASMDAEASGVGSETVEESKKSREDIKVKKVTANTVLMKMKTTVQENSILQEMSKCALCMPFYARSNGTVWQQKQKT